MQQGFPPRLVLFPSIRWLSSALFLLFFALRPGAARGYGTDLFPCPAELAPRVAFWERIFTEFSDKQRVIHDVRYPWVIYEVFPVDGMNQKQIKARVQSRKDYYSSLLKRMTGRDPASFNLEEQRVADLLASVPAEARYAAPKERIRSQPGVRELFRVAVRRSDRYLPSIQGVLDSVGVPREIAYIPFVESSFNPTARSKAGALGLWQFTRKTGKQYLRVERDLDERLDPFCATEAAARYLRGAYSALKSWPLAVTAYNHGVGGMLRAQSSLGADNFARVLLEYDGPSFGFASQNFYCEFLAAMEVARASDRHFGELLPDPPLFLDTFRLPGAAAFPSLARAFALDPAELASVNPALGRPFLSGLRSLPSGYALRLPLGAVTDPVVQFASLARVRTVPEVASAPPPGGYKVRPGDTLSQIARRHRVPVGDLRRANDLRPGDRIYPGQLLVVPDRSEAGL